MWTVLERGLLLDRLKRARRRDPRRKDADLAVAHVTSLKTPFPRRGGRTFPDPERQFARMAPGPSTRVAAVLAPPTPRIWLTAGALLAVACQGGGERPLETSAGLSLDPWGLAEPAAAAARASEPVIAQPAVGQIRTSGAVPRAPGG